MCGAGPPPGKTFASIKLYVLPVSSFDATIVLMSPATAILSSFVRFNDFYISIFHCLVVVHLLSIICFITLYNYLQIIDGVFNIKSRWSIQY